MLKINKGKKNRTRRVLIYGENGVGKSSIAAQFPNPIFLNLEDGIGDLDVDSTDVLTNLTAFTSCLIHLGETKYQTIVVDTIDWLEKLLFEEVAKEAGKRTIDDIGFGKGYQAVERKWKELIRGFTWLWQQDRHIVFTCHERIEKFTNPEGDSYNYWAPALHEKGSGCITEWCDEVLFVRFKTNTIQKDEGFGNKRAIAVGGKDRVIVCNKQASVEAKNRLSMPDELPLSFDALRHFLPVINKKSQTNGNIEGVVVDGSSKQPVTEELETPF